MPKHNARLTQINQLPITWLSESKLKSSIFLREQTVSTDRAHDVLAHLLRSESSHSSRYVVRSLDLSDKEFLNRASEDYMRCVLAKSLAEIYRKATPKYRNEAARKQFFKRLASATEAIHLTESSERLSKIVDSAEEDDEIAIWLKPELDRLIAERIDLASEYNSQLNAARVEFNAALRQLENLTGMGWPESDRFTRTLSIASFFPPGICESENTWRWGSQWYPEAGILNLNPPILFFDVIRKAVLAREAAILLSPRNLEALEDEPRMLCEQSEYLAHKLLDKKNDKELWGESRHGLRQKTRFRANEVIDFFLYYEMMVGDSLYRELWSRLKELGDAQLGVSDYFTIFNSLASRPSSPKFNKTELRLLDLLCKKPNVSAGEASHALGLSIPTTMKTITQLSRKAGLLFTAIVNMSRIGLVENLVFISAKSEVFPILARFPYCRQIFRTYGSYDLFAVIDAPEERSGFVRRFLDRMIERGLLSGYKLVCLVRDCQSVNFAGYDMKLGRWVIHWDTWGVRLQDSLSKSKTVSVDDSTQAERYRFDKLDLNILSMIAYDCRAPFSSIGRNLEVSGAYVGKKIARMAREDVFRYALWPLKIGAEDWGLVALSCSADVASTLSHYLSSLPAWRGGMVKGDFDGLVAMVWSPNGELRQLFKAIDDRLVRRGHAQVHCLNSVGEWALARWLPVTRDDPWQLCTDEGTWLFDEEKYMSLIV